jgi:hypothetical protein
MAEIFKRTYKDIPQGLGNYLCYYFAKMGSYFSNNQNFVNDEPFNTDFLSDLPLNVCNSQELNNIDYRSAFSNHCCEYYSWWELHNNNNYLFWNALKPTIHKILESVLQKNNLVKTVNYPIIHYRCSNTPFIRHGSYHFQRYSFFIDSLNELKEQGVDTSTVYIMYCFTPHANTINTLVQSQIYIDSLKENIENNGHRVILINTQSSLDDFALLFYAPACISTSSSFSFFSGFFGKGIFISGYHTEYEENTCTASCIKKGYSLNHCDVADYNDTSTVISQLKVI